MISREQYDVLREAMHKRAPTTAQIKLGASVHVEVRGLVVETVTVEAPTGVRSFSVQLEIYRDNVNHRRKLFDALGVSFDDSRNRVVLASDLPYSLFISVKLKDEDEPSLREEDVDEDPGEAVIEDAA